MDARKSSSARVGSPRSCAAGPRQRAVFATVHRRRRHRGCLPPALAAVPALLSRACADDNRKASRGRVRRDLAAAAATSLGPPYPSPSCGQPLSSQRGHACWGISKAVAAAQASLAMGFRTRFRRPRPVGQRPSSALAQPRPQAPMQRLSAVPPRARALVRARLGFARRRRSVILRQRRGGRGVRRFAGGAGASREGRRGGPDFCSRGLSLTRTARASRRGCAGTERGSSLGSIFFSKAASPAPCSWATSRARRLVRGAGCRAHRLDATTVAMPRRATSGVRLVLVLVFFTSHRSLRGVGGDCGFVGRGQQRQGKAPARRSPTALSRGTWRAAREGLCWRLP